MVCTAPKHWEWGVNTGPVRGRNLFILFFLLGLLPRLLVLNIALQRDRPVYHSQDSWGYIIPAESLIERTGFQGKEGKPSFWWPPGYSGFLALTFATGIASPDQLAGALLVQVVLASLVAGMVSLLALDLGGKAAALLAGGLMALEPSSIAHASVIFAETLFTFLLVLAILIWNWWWTSSKTYHLLAFASLVGLLPLVRPVATYLWIPIALLLVAVRPACVPRGRALVLFITLATLPAALWTLRNYSYLRVPVFATVGQFNEAGFARAVEDLAGVPRAASPFRQPWHEGFGSDQGMSFPQIVKARELYFRGVLMRHPVAALKRLTMTGVGILGVPDSRLPDLVLSEVPDFEGGSVWSRLIWLWRLRWLGGILLLGMVVSVGGALALPLLALRARAWPRKRQALPGLLTLLISYQLLISSFIMYQSERFRVPIIPLLVVAFACALLGHRSGGEPARVAGDERAP